jgi:FlaA1/EpsC-like NDP-sugar epimerase
MLTLQEQEQLLGRQVQPLLGAVDRRRFTDRSVLITGAGGSIGSELARQIASCRPARLTLVDHSEHALFEIERELNGCAAGVTIDPVLADITRARNLSQAFGRARPQVVFHAAAYKHVTMAERAVCAAARVNVLGTCAVLAAARDVNARVVLVSSDKAASPRSVMGATKRLAEIATVAEAAVGVHASVVRFGNVLASSGSFIEVMWRRIQEGQSLLITDPAATRYFMTVGEAASLVLKAELTSHSGETFWLDMGAPIPIGDLAARLLDVAEARGYARVPVETIGLRPGEKLAEELTSQGLAMMRTANERVWVARQAPVAENATDAVRALARAVTANDALATLRTLTNAVADYEPSAYAWTCARKDCLYTRGAQNARAKKIA